MQDDFDKLNEIFGVAPKNKGLGEEVSKPAGERKSPLQRLDDILYDPEKHQSKPAEEAEPDERDYRPIRRRRDNRIGCMGGIMYFVFVVSLSIILACLGWMAATDVLALNKADLTAEVTLPDSIFTPDVIEVEDADGNKTQKPVDRADVSYVARLLKDAGIIEYKFLFTLFCKVSDADIKMDPGTYELTTDYDYRALVKKMQAGSGAALTVDLTFPEGWDMEQIFSHLDEKADIDKDELYTAAADYIYNYSFLEGVETGDAQRLEGFLFPDTYQFYVGMQASSAINTFLSNYHRKITADMYQQVENSGLTLKQIMTIASMIEGEAANDEERPYIASVIYNRLNAGMPLQIDATVMYALGEHKEYLTYEDTQVDSPYNTYKILGLPPGPISNPGLPSIQAALRPERTSYLYYALDTATDTHRFFEELDEFEAFVATQDYTNQ